MSWLNIFSGTAQRSSFPEYELITPTADVTLVWPIESIVGTSVYYVADWIDVNGTDCDEILMPDARQAATGISCIIANVGTQAFELQDNLGNEIVVIDPGLAWVIVLTDNSTQQGTWRAIQFGAFTSDAQAGALAGAGLEANFTLLRSKIAPLIVSDSNLTITETHRANALVLTGPNPHTFQLSAIGTGVGATIKPGWWCLIANESDGELTIDASGADTINRALADIVLPPVTTDQAHTVLIVCSSTGFHTFGGMPIPVPINSGGTGATTANGALTNFGGTAVGISIFTAPSAAAILTLLGIQQALLVESTVAVTQTLTNADAGKCYVATAALTINLPEAGTVGNDFFIAVLAQGGDVTVDPPIADKMNGGALGTPLVIKQGASALIVNDGASPNGTWWTFFLDNSSGVWAVAAGSADAITAVYDPPYTTLADGQLLYFRALGANSLINPTFSPDGLTAYPITKAGGLPLAPGDISNALFEAIIRYNLAGTRWELLNPSGGGGGGAGGIPWVVAGGTADVISAAYNPPIPALIDGQFLMFRATGANTVTAPTFQPNAQIAYPITKMGGIALSIGDIPGVGFEALLKHNATFNRWELLNPAFPGGSSGGGGGGAGSSFSGLRIANNGGSPNSQVDVSASAIGVAPASGSPVLTLLNPAFTINALTVGVANGIDAGSLANDTWYAVYAISDGTSGAGLLSTNFTSPVLPAGYTYFGRIGAMRTNGSAQFRRTLQRGRTARYTETLQRMASGAAGSVHIPNWVPVTVSNYVPTTASEIAFGAMCEGTNGVVIVAPNSAAFGKFNSLTATPLVDGQSPGSTNVISQLGEFLLESNTIYWASQGTDGALFAYGWTDNL